MLDHQNPLNRHYRFLYLAGLVAAAAVAIVYWAASDSKFDEKDWISFGALVVALLTFLTREFLAARATRRQHTVTVLLQSRLSTAFNERLKAMDKHYPSAPSLVRFQIADWQIADKSDAIQGLRYLLNYYEFIATGIRIGDLDEDFLFETVGGIVANLCNIGEHFISEAQKRHASVYEHVIWLRDRWAHRRAEMDAKRKTSKKIRM